MAPTPYTAADANTAGDPGVAPIASRGAATTATAHRIVVTRSATDTRAANRSPRLATPRLYYATQEAVCRSAATLRAGLAPRGHPQRVWNVRFAARPAAAVLLAITNASAPAAARPDGITFKTRTGPASCVPHARVTRHGDAGGRTGAGACYTRGSAFGSIETHPTRVPRADHGQHIHGCHHRTLQRSAAARSRQSR